MNENTNTRATVKSELEARKLEEIAFHDKLRTGQHEQRWSPEAEARVADDPLWSNFKDYAIEGHSLALMKRWLLEHGPGGVVLDYCCGNGDESLYLAREGAKKVTGIDISPVSIANCSTRAREAKLDDRVDFRVMDAEALEFPDDTFDLIMEYGVLHHLELDRAMAELARVVKPGGAVVCTETLAHNPLIPPIPAAHARVADGLGGRAHPWQVVVRRDGAPLRPRREAVLPSDNPRGRAAAPQPGLSAGAGNAPGGGPRAPEPARPAVAGVAGRLSPVGAEEAGGRLALTRRRTAAILTLAPPGFLSTVYPFFKRAIDVLAAAAGLLLLSPALIAIALAIRLTSPGPAIYRGRRVGLGGRPFDMYKFRTMRADAERVGGTSTPADDPRVTTVGGFLRRHKLDELPQLMNVLKGDMSLVGPRPQVQWDVDTYTDEERRLLSVRPGITDYASLAFRDEGEILRGHEDADAAYVRLIRPEKIRLGLEYVRRVSLRTDLAILMRTTRVIAGLDRGVKQGGEQTKP